jgi:lysylphosphatidylglycerol synthetase-like protein (DUF2156 family)
MTINTAIAWANAVIAVGMVITGLVFFWRAFRRKALWEWPPSVLILLGVVPFLVGIAWMQTVVFRIQDFPEGGHFGLNGIGTMALRWVTAIIVVGRLVRVAHGRLLSPKDYQRLDGDT